MASGSLVLGSGSSASTPSFVQQGQIDWVAFGKTTWIASAEILQRFASADVQPVTFGAGIVLASQFRLSPRGQQRMEEALSRLKGLPVFLDTLWLGFGYRSVISTMANTVGGIKCVALCSSLADVHSENSAAWILAELWKESGYPDEYEPSHSQFLALVKVCTGVLVKTPFIEIIDIMLGDMLWKISVGQDEIPVASNFKDIARALRGLFQLTMGKVDSIFVTGGGECAFIAALAHFLFDLKIHVESVTGELIFASVLDSESVKVRVQYGLLHDTAIALPSTTYVLGDCRAVFDRVFQAADMVFMVRTPWDGCLRRTFGTRFRVLADLPHLLGSYLGSLARIYNGLARGEPNVRTLSRTFYVDYGEASHGQGFIHLILSTFPELDRVDGLQHIMEMAADQSFDEALKAVEQSIQALETLCDCRACSSAPKQSEFYEQRSCLIGMSYAIREISRTMASVVLDPQDDQPLLPSVEGIKEFFRHGKGDKLYRVTAKDGQNIVTPRGDRAGFAYHVLGLCETGDEESFKFHPLYNVSLLFQGVRLLDKETGLSSMQATYTALSHRGVCCYVDGLRSLTSQAELVRLVHILAGNINYKDRPYTSVRDFDQLGGLTSSSSKLDNEAAQVLPASVTVPDDKASPNLDVHFAVEPLATETAAGDSIYCSYRVSASTFSITLHPGRLMMEILWRSGQIICSNGPSCNSELALPCSVVKCGWTIRVGKTENLTYTLRVACCIWPLQDDIARCLVLKAHFMGEGTNVRRNTVFVRRRECLPCCSIAVLKEKEPVVKGEISYDRGIHWENTIMHIIRTLIVYLLFPRV